MYCLCLLLALALAARGALPPISPENRIAWSSHIIVGRVTGVSVSEEEKRPGLVNSVYDVEVEVTEFDKGSYDQTNVHVFFWKRKSRPAGFVGDSGLYGDVPLIGDSIRAFTTLHEGVFDVLNPNGLDITDRASASEEPPKTETPTELVQRLISTNKIVVFSKSYCPYCAKAKAAFLNLDVPHQVIELDRRDDGAAIQDALRQITQRHTVPQVFINAKFIGGGDDTVRLFASGELRRLIDAV